ncbi:hypothetical protein FD28_GL001895 [Levilactobacillus hammesii DSM 16381]|uniref:Uncharacterized protein n=1 Tax=Levilactobacillus hammesii DSM 16381 TaxID=1423753 RepID=A0A0R1V0B8_9LACO|nr:hypothetical protein FD28_GL001895 [Levilactobacillus hammesii DSM 16381]
MLKAYHVSANLSKLILKLRHSQIGRTSRPSSKLCNRLQRRRLSVLPQPYFSKIKGN